MKTFSSSASRVRTIATIVQIGGVVTCLAAGIFLIVAVVRRPPDFADLPVLRQKLPSEQLSRKELVEALASRSFRQELVPRVLVAPAVAQVAQASPPSIEVIATIVNPGKIPSAYIRSKAAGKLHTVRPGETIDGAVVKEITEGCVVFQFQGQDFPIYMGKKVGS